MTPLPAPLFRTGQSSLTADVFYGQPLTISKFQGIDRILFVFVKGHFHARTATKEEGQDTILDYQKLRSQLIFRKFSLLGVAKIFEFLTV